MKKVESWRTDDFELWCWRRFLRVPWTARKSNQSILKEISPEYSLKGLMLQLKLQYFGHLMWRTGSLEKTLMLGKIEGREGDDRGWDDWMASLTQWTWVWVSSGKQWKTGKPGMLQFMGLQRMGHDWETGQKPCMPCALAYDLKPNTEKHTFSHKALKIKWQAKQMPSCPYKTFNCSENVGIEINK